MIKFSPEPSGHAMFETFLHHLLLADWEALDGPLRLSADLKAADLASVDFFQNTRIFLGALAESKGVPPTATGNLPRVFVRQMFDRLQLPVGLRASTLSVCKVLNEPDVWPLHMVRIVSECAGLLSRRNKRFQLTRSGQNLLPEDQAGLLFRKLFIAYFRRFDLHYRFPYRKVPGIQQTMGVILWRLETVAQDWVPVKGLAPELLLPGVLNQLHEAMISPYDNEEWILRGYVLEPLVSLGLLEIRTEGQRDLLAEKDSIRVTDLWRKFIFFPQRR